jgi:hypothetical protein
MRRCVVFGEHSRGVIRSCKGKVSQELSGLEVNCSSIEGLLNIQRMRIALTEKRERLGAMVKGFQFQRPSGGARALKFGGLLSVGIDMGSLLVTALHKAWVAVVGVLIDAGLFEDTNRSYLSPASRKLGSKIRAAST